ncbi:MAG: DUF1003 domain-containing protein [Gemmataceae bacterium]
MSVADSIQERTRRNVVAINEMHRQLEARRTPGDRLADLVAATVGSWGFLVLQSCLLGVWIVLNVVGIVYHWDPYPFILLNLALSFQAAYATPVIMMSQNRQARLAELRNQLDLQINLLAEQENTEQLRLLHLLCEKVGIPVEQHGVKGLEQETRPAEIVRQLEQANGAATCKAAHSGVPVHL